MAMPLGIYKVIGVDEYVVGAEQGGLFVTSEVLDAEDVEDLIMEEMLLEDYELDAERARPASDFEHIPHARWVEIAATEVKE